MSHATGCKLFVVKASNIGVSDEEEVRERECVCVYQTGYVVVASFLL